MSQVHKWWGKPLASGYQEQTMAIFRDHPERKLALKQVADALRAKPETISNTLSVLTTEGWLVRLDTGDYRLAIPAPIEDRTRPHIPIPRNRTTAIATTVTIPATTVSHSINQPMMYEEVGTTGSGETVVRDEKGKLWKISGEL
jgi:hypothetical protein